MNKVEDTESKAYICSMMTDILEIVHHLEEHEYNRFYVELWDDSKDKQVFNFDILGSILEASKKGLIHNLKKRYKDLEASLVRLK